MDPQIDRDDDSDCKKKKTKQNSNVLVSGFMLVLSSVVRIIGFVWFMISLVTSVISGGGKRKENIQLLRRNVLHTRERCKDDPVGSMKKMLKFLWCLGVIFATLSLLGFDMNPSRQLQVAGDLWGFNSMPAQVPIKEPLNKEEEDEENLQQNLGPKKKKITKKEERAFACAEVECLEKCARKVTKKCMKSESCLNHRAKECKKKCKKKRCDDRCAREPMSYVERETKLEECKEQCKVPKCTAKCEYDFQPCRNKCKFLYHKYICDREPDLPTVRMEEPAPLKGKGSAPAQQLDPAEDLLGDDIESI
mmetsp:Transcript_7811/g.9908  ORF Transcript_7811/g.9908 Transcript_7811/m.9908 type:complete len:306 (-) Transcript_7811:1075-1992(-)